MGFETNVAVVHGLVSCVSDVCVGGKICLVNSSFAGSIFHQQEPNIEDVDDGFGPSLHPSPYDNSKEKEILGAWNTGKKGVQHTRGPELLGHLICERLAMSDMKLV